MRYDEKESALQKSGGRTFQAVEGHVQRSSHRNKLAISEEDTERSVLGNWRSSQVIGHVGPCGPW